MGSTGSLWLRSLRRRHISLSAFFVSVEFGTCLRTVAKSVRVAPAVSLSGSGRLSRCTGQRTDASCGELEAPFARLAATITRLKEPWIKDESAASTLLSGVISVEYLAHQGSTHAMKAKLTLLASAMLQPCLRGIWQWARGL